MGSPTARVDRLEEIAPVPDRLPDPFQMLR
jgi:hypothetical protein